MNRFEVTAEEPFRCETVELKEGGITVKVKYTPAPEEAAKATYPVVTLTDAETFDSWIRKGKPLPRAWMITEIIRRNQKFTIGFDGHGEKRRRFDPQTTPLVGPIPTEFEVQFDGGSACLKLDDATYESDTRIVQEEGDRVTVFFGFPDDIKGAENKAPVGAVIEYEIL
jgi:hypothetical protein